MTHRIRGWVGADIADAEMPQGQKVYVRRSDARRQVLLAFLLGGLCVAFPALLIVGGAQ